MRKAILLADLANQFKAFEVTDTLRDLVDNIDAQLFRDGVIEIRGDFCVMCDHERAVR